MILLLLALGGLSVHLAYRTGNTDSFLGLDDLTDKSGNPNAKPSDVTQSLMGSSDSNGSGDTPSEPSPSRKPATEKKHYPNGQWNVGKLHIRIDEILKQPEAQRVGLLLDDLKALSQLKGYDSFLCWPAFLNILKEVGGDWVADFLFTVLSTKKELGKSILSRFEKALGELARNNGRAVGYCVQLIDSRTSISSRDGLIHGLSRVCDDRIDQALIRALDEGRFSGDLCFFISFHIDVSQILERILLGSGPANKAGIARVFAAISPENVIQLTRIFYSDKGVNLKNSIIYAIQDLKRGSNINGKTLPDETWSEIERVILTALDDRDSMIREAACYTFNDNKDLSSQRAKAKLEQMLAEEADKDVRYAVKSALDVVNENLK